MSNVKGQRLNVQHGFTLVEMVVYVGILTLVILLVTSFMFYLHYANSQTQGDREVLESARRALENMVYEVNGARSIYTPTTTASQLSLETLRYIPAGESTTYIDFFICDTTRLCLKKESQNPIYLTPDSVNITSLAIAQINANNSPSVKITLAMTFKNPTNNLIQSVSLTQVASLRNY